MRYLNKALDAHKRRDYKKRDVYTGYWNHFALDAWCIGHAEFVPAPKGHPIRVLHKKIETIADKRKEKIIPKTKLNPDIGENLSYEDILLAGMRQNKDLYLKMQSGDFNKLSDLVDASLQNAYKSMSKIMKKFTMELKSQDTQLELFDTNVKVG
jgi:hypothetical protein